MTSPIGAATAAAKAERFYALHQSGCFIAPNPWDLGSARVLAALGAPALLTTSSGYAFTRGLPDGAHVGQAEAVHHAAEINAATALPVSADLENGYAATPDGVAAVIALAGAAGLAGASIEDTDLTAEDASFGFEEAVARLTAAVAAARAAPHRFTLTARADGLLTGAYDLEEAIRRLRAFEAAGADVLYAPGVPDVAALSRLCAAVTAPVNALAAGPLLGADAAALAKAGARRISLGSSLARKAHAVLIDAGRGLFDSGDFGPTRGGAAGGIVDKLLAAGGGLGMSD